MTTLTSWWRRLLGVAPVVTRPQVRTSPLPMRGAAGIKAAYRGGMVGDRLLESLHGEYGSADRPIAASLATVRARARHLAENNAWMRRWLRQMIIGVLGPRGVILQNQARDENSKHDIEANRAIEDHWTRWGATCDVAGRLTFKQLADLALTSTVRDGEIFIRLVPGWQGNGYRLGVQVLEADMVDDQLTRRLPTGGRITMGIETDEWGRRVRYYVLQDHPGDRERRAGLPYIIVPAEQMIHIYLSDRPGQTRGVPWVHASMAMMHHLEQYVEAAVVNARIGACKMGFYTEGNTDIPLSELATREETETGELITNVLPGVFDKLPRGWGFEPYDPTYPSGEFAEFFRAILKAFAAGVGVSYASLSGDLSDTSYASSRVGIIDDRDHYRWLQRWFIGAFYAPLYAIWLDTALLASAITTSAGRPLPWAKRAKFAEAHWQTRGYDWVDPVKDIDAEVMAIYAGLKTRTEALAERGRDLRETMQQLAEEEELAASLGLMFSRGKTEAARQTVPVEDERN